MNFLDLGLSDVTIKAMEELGITEPTTVQTDVIPSILQGKDIFTIAPQGCGKTCSYVFPLLDIISRAQESNVEATPNILIITPDSQQSVAVSDWLAIFNKYHAEAETEEKEADENIEKEANVIIGSPDLLVDLLETQKVDLSKTNILVVDDINLIKKRKQLDNLEKILDILPAEKQNIVYTNRRSKETQGILDKILKAPQEIKVDKAKEQEVQQVATAAQLADNKNDTSGRKASRNVSKNTARFAEPVKDKESAELIKKFDTFAGKTPDFITYKGLLVRDGNA